MQNNLQKLTEKIYQEGIEKANEEAEKLLAKAREDALKIIRDAEKEGTEILAQAEKKAEELRKNTLSELTLSSKQAINDIKHKIQTLLKIQVIDPPLKEAFKDAEFIKSIIETAMSRWEPCKDQQLELTVLLPEKKESELQRYFIAKSEQFLNQGVDLCFEESLQCGFRIGPKDGGYVISFSDQDFENFFRAYLRPKMIRFLYGGAEHE